MHRHEEITVLEASRGLARYRIVDVRQPEEFTGELGHIAGSLLLPLGELIERLERGHEPGDVFASDTDEAYLLVCRSGNRSGQACARLAEAGVPRVLNLLGGMLEWNRLGLPVVRLAEDVDAERTG